MAAPLIEAYPGPIIQAGQSLSDQIDLTGTQMLLRVWLPVAWNNNAQLTFQISYDGITYRDLFDADGFEYVRTVVPGVIMVIEPLYGRCLPHIKFRSGTRSKPVVQTAQRIFTCICEK